MTVTAVNLFAELGITSRRELGRRFPSATGSSTPRDDREKRHERVR